MADSAPAWWPSREAFLAAPLAPDGLARLASEVVPGGSAQDRGPLEGGMESAVHAVDLVDGMGRARPAVLKRRQSFAVDGRSELAALQAAAPAGVATPAPLGFDPDGRWFGGPALVMSRLLGAAHLGQSDDAALGELARALAAIHDCDGAGLEESAPRWRRGAPGDASAFEESVWAQIDTLAVDAGPATALVHGDFHPGNALWHEGRLSGVVDWENGARGWPGEDVAKCRWYLEFLHGRAAADLFLAAYEAEVGGEVELLAVCDASYAIGLLRWADQRAFFLRRSGFPAATAETIRATTRSFVIRALGIADERTTS